MKAEKKERNLAAVLVGIVIVAYTGLMTYFVLDTPSQSSLSFQSNPSLVMNVERTIDSVVHVSNESMGWQGSGVAVTKDIIMTARHVVEGGTRFVVTLNDGREIEAHVAISSKRHDLGFIKLGQPILTPAEFGSIADCNLGQAVYAIGSPYGKLNFNSVTFGILSGLGRNCDELNSWGYDYGWSIAFTTDSAGHPGNSGCPVFTMDGVVRGILVGGHSPVLIYCMPVDLVLDDLSVIETLFLQNKYYFEETKMEIQPLEEY